MIDRVLGATRWHIVGYSAAAGDFTTICGQAVREDSEPWVTPDEPLEGDCGTCRRIAFRRASTGEGK